jgi:hypothetical protein
MAFIDLRTSQGPRAVAIPTTPDYVAGIGLSVGAATGIRCDLEASVGVNDTTSGSNFLIQVVRQSSSNALGTFEAANVIYSQSFGLSTATTITTFSLSAADFNVPATFSTNGILAYGLYVNASALGATYQGLQNLIGTASN